MCELLGMSFNLPVNPRISFMGFRRRGDENPDGWGIAFYPDEPCASAQVIKQPVKAGQSKLSKFLQDYQEIRSKIFISHVRRASKGSKCHKNTHPFYRELNGKEYVFAHNGTLYNYGSLKLGRFKPIGDTDSEYVFCHLLHLIEEKNIFVWEQDNFDWLAETLKKINQHGTFNCVFSDGEYLFCYFDKNSYNSLYFVQRRSPYGEILLLDEDMRINLADEKNPNQRGYIIATKKLTDEPWEAFKAGEIIVFKNGEIVYSNLP